MNITFYGGARSVTGANYLVEADGAKILIDCGLMQGCPLCYQENFRAFPYKPKQINALVLTHAHLDHIGRAPKLVKDGFRGKIYATPPTRAFMRAMFDDALYIMEEDFERNSTPALYGRQDVEQLFSQMEECEYEKEITINNSLKFTLYNAGHVLGSSIVKVRNGNRQLIFSGDLGNGLVPLLKPPERFKQADVVIMESTYGDRLHEDVATRKDRLEDVIEDTTARGGTLIIAAFSMERTQELLYEINELVEHHRIQQVPVFVDSPLAIKLTKIFERFRNRFNASAQQLIKQGDRLFRFPGLKLTESVEESKKINKVPSPKVIIAGSGMSTGGRILHHEKRYLPDAKNCLLITGYQAAGTLGRELLDGAKTVSIFNEKIKVRAQVKKIGGYSAHADQAALLEWLKPMRHSVKNVYLVQGEQQAAEVLAVKIRDQLGIAASVPLYGDRVEV